MFTKFSLPTICFLTLAGCQLQPQTADSSLIQVQQSTVPQPVVQASPAIFEHRAIISSGYANISAQRSDNPSQRRLMAIRASKVDAYRNLTEKVYGQNINASTTVEEAVTIHDAIRAQVDGLIYGARLVSITPIGSDSYETRLEIDESDVEAIRQRYLFVN